MPSSKYKFHAQVEYNYHFTRFQTEHAQLLGMMDSLGINMNPAIIWNALPWSFVIDWFIGVSRWLDDRKVLNMEPTINISRFLWSWKVARNIRVSAMRTGGTYNRPPNLVTLREMTETAYRRDTSLLHSNSLIASGLSNKELSLGVALLIPSYRRRPSRGYRTSQYKA
jgi:hypothetical protein